MKHLFFFLGVLLLSCRSEAFIPETPNPYPHGLRVYIAKAMPSGERMTHFAAQQTRGDSVSFALDHDMAISAMSVRIKTPGDSHGGQDAWKCADGRQSLAVSMDAGAAMGHGLMSKGLIQGKKGDRITCVHSSSTAEEVKPFVSVILLEN